MQFKESLLSKQLILCFICLFPFFEPLVIDLLIKNYPSQNLWVVINALFKIAELIISTYTYILWIIQILKLGKWKLNEIDYLLVIHLLLMIISCFFNKNFSISFFGSTYCSIALLLLSEKLLMVSKGDFLKAGKFLFGFWTWYGILTAFLFPNGYNYDTSTTRYNAIFGLGAKNNAFPFFFTYLFFVFADNIRKSKTISLRFLIPIIGMISAALIFTSVNTIICICLVACLFFIAKLKFRILKKNIAVLGLAVLSISCIIVYVGFNMPIMERLLIQFGRNIAFSHRDVLWKRAISLFKMNKLWGAGVNIEYPSIWAGITTSHAHSQYLDKLAKFGLIPFTFLVVAIIKLFINISNCKNMYQVNIIAIMTLIYMVHMSFDTYNYNFFILILVVLNNFVKQEIKVNRKYKSK